MIDYRVVVEKTGTGFSAHSPDVPGVAATAKTRAAVELLFREAVAFHLEPEDELA
jgi:predicted RNase H-like HicB family nuclease